MSRASAERRPVERPFRVGPWAALLGLMAAPAHATVLEVADDGAVIVHDVARAAPTPAGKVAQRRSAPRAAGAPPALRPHIDAAADGYELSPELIEAVAWAESRYRQEAVSRAGARGVMQLMPGTARELGVDPRDTAANIRGGTAYLRRLLTRYAGDVVKTLAAYNAGPGAVDRFGGVPPYRETRAYVEAILARLASRAADPA